MSNRIRVLIADDHRLIRAGIRALLEKEEEIEVVGEACDGLEAIIKTRALHPDVVLLDLQMPRKSGIEALQTIKVEDPQARVLVLTSYADDARVFMAIKEGALGYLLKESSTRDLIVAIRNVYSGEYSLHPAIARKLIYEMKRPSSMVVFDESLTERESEVLLLVARGLSNQEIANSLGIRERTVSTHVSNILSKLHLVNRTQATLYALKEGLVSLEQVSSLTKKLI
ncbi:MAG: response regulator transcription factor [Chloroflexi bacterium]|nr:response regulator transcription factor [Chloroflexota bacterium]